MGMDRSPTDQRLVVYLTGMRDRIRIWMFCMNLFLMVPNVGHLDLGLADRQTLQCSRRFAGLENDWSGCCYGQGIPTIGYPNKIMMYFHHQEHVNLLMPWYLREGKEIARCEIGVRV